MAADGYWRFAVDRRDQAAAAAQMPPPQLKRPRPDYPEIGGPEYYGYYPRPEERMVHRPTREAEYDRYYHNEVQSGFGEPARPVPGGLSGYGEPARPVPGGLSGYGEPARLAPRGLSGYDEPARHVPGRQSGYGETARPETAGLSGYDEPARHVPGGLTARPGYIGGNPEKMLPPDASNTLFVEGLPSDSTRREVSHIFRPFVGFKEVRLVNKESKRAGGDGLILCFVDFSTPAQAAVALDALQGYKFDDEAGVDLRLQFARFPGNSRSGGGPRSKR